jgi:uncharacterized protein YjbI with pentapeptide repeats/uncharacterized RDD family membrane protein YckC
MTSSTTSSGMYTASNTDSRWAKVRQAPLLIRRGAALAAEVSLVALSAVTPFAIGHSVKSMTDGGVPLNPVLAKVEGTIADTLGLPAPAEDRPVSPLTNLLWSGAIVLPLAVGGWQLYLLSKTGQTLPKKLLGIQVVTAAGLPPTLKQVLLREGVGRWGLVLSVAYGIWRYSGAFPDLGILAGLSGLLVLGEGWMARFQAQGRTLHDRIGGTYILDTVQTIAPYPQTVVYSTGVRETRPLRWSQPERNRAYSWNGVDEEAAIAAIVLSPNGPERLPTPGLWGWMRQHPGTTLVVGTASIVSAALLAFVGTQIYIQTQETARDAKRQDNEVFLQLVNKLTPDAPSAKAPDERRTGILALATLNDSRAIPLLIALLSQENVPMMMDATQQALVMMGPTALEALRDLNQTLKNDLDSLRDGGQLEEQESIALRLRSTQRAMSKILTLRGGEVANIDLNRVDLGQNTSPTSAFTLVLDRANLAGLQLRGAILAHASLKGTVFYAAGPDGRFDTTDDWIAELGGADLRDANLSEAMLGRVRMERTNLMRSNLTKANLSGASLAGANLSSAQLVSANLHNTLLSGASLTGADLTQVDLSGANLRGASLGQAIAIDANLQGANLGQTNWQDADLSSADLMNTNWQNANLSAATLEGANLQKANLENANLQGANLSGADLREAKLEGANFQGVTFVPAVSTEGEEFITRSPNTATVTQVKGVDFSKVKNLTSEQMGYLCQQGAVHPQCPRR